MNEIIEALIQWCIDNGYFVDIQIGSAFPSYAVSITLKKGKFRYKHEFYIAGGVLCLDRWRDFPREPEIEAFLKNAKEEFERAKGNGEVTYE